MYTAFRRPVSETDTRQDEEIFSDNSSRMDMVNHVIKTRMLPLICIFFCCLLPNFINSVEQDGPFPDIITIIFSILLVIYLYLFIHCGLKLREMKQKYK